MSRDLIGGEPLWPERERASSPFPALTTSVEADIAILGGGISGALIAHSFAQAGMKVIVIDKRRIAHGSTSGSTALLQYEIDVPLSELKDQIGIAPAERAYILCGQAIQKIGVIAAEYHDPSFSLRPSLYLASKFDDLAFMRKEFKARQDAGFEVSWLDTQTLRHEYGIHAPGAIRSELGGQVDPYTLTHSILKELQKRGHFVFEKTEIDIDSIETGTTVTMKSTEGYEIRAKKLIFASGYESKDFLKEKIVTLRSSYALATKKQPEKNTWKDNALLWDTAKPYMYARTTDDGRIILGGGDTSFRNAFLRDLFITYKAWKLKKDFRKYFPQKKLEIDFTWTGTFGETRDGLAYIGESPEWPNAYFALGFGGNGIAYSALAGDLLLRLYNGEKPQDLHLFRFGRN